MAKRKQTWHGLSSDWTVVEWRHRRKGPVPGTVDRYGASDRKLYPELEQLAEKCGSVTAAARELAEQGKVAGTGTSTKESRARRLAGRYFRDHSKSRWHAS
jgi:hypothetical protein